MTNKNTQKNLLPTPSHTAGAPSGTTPIVADLMAAELMNSREHLQERLQWIESEISELSTRMGLFNRINGLRAARAGILANCVISDAMAKSKINLPMPSARL